MAGGFARIALIPMACGAMLAVAACGSDDSESTPTPQLSPVMGTDAATSTSASPPTSPPDSTEPAVSSDGLIPTDLPALDDPVRTYVWTADQRPTRDDVDALADALGVTGEVSDGIHGADGGWTLDGDNLTLTLDAGPEGAWYYSGPPPFPWPSEEEPWPTTETGEPVTIAPPVSYTVPGAPLPDSFPSPEEAQALAREIVAALGHDSERFEWRDGQRNFAAGVEAWWLVDGTVAPVHLDFGFGPDGVLTYASGQLVGPQAGPQVDRIGTAAAEERLRAEIERTRTELPDGGNMVVGGFVVPGDPHATIVLPEPGEPSGTTAPPIKESPPPATTAPVPTVPPEMVGRIVDVEESWQVVRDESGTRLLPAYTFIEATGMRYTVSAAP